MRDCNAGRARDARLINGVALLGGRGASALEVDIALGLDPRPARASRLWTWLRALVVRYGAPAVAKALRHPDPVARILPQVSLDAA